MDHFNEAEWKEKKGGGLAKGKDGKNCLYGRVEGKSVKYAGKTERKHRSGWSICTREN